MATKNVEVLLGPNPQNCRLRYSGDTARANQTSERPTSHPTGIQAQSDLRDEFSGASNASWRLGAQRDSCLLPPPRPTRILRADVNPHDIMIFMILRFTILFFTFLSIGSVEVIIPVLRT
jgi:hypothetical protein